MGKQAVTINELLPGERLYLDVRAGFVSQGTTLTAWCKEHGVGQPSARLSLLGAWNGPKAKKLRAELIRASRASPQHQISA